jgi:hypothetical protein
MKPGVFHPQKENHKDSLACFEIANFKIVRLPDPHAGIGKDQDVVSQQPTGV